jgi:formamidopyrimidine-DNA glycosylase
MPELPDVENFVRYFRKHALRQVIEGVSVVDRRVLRKLPAERLRRRVIGRRFVAVRRHGKHLLARLDDGGWITLHFGMTGSLAHFKDDEPPYDRLRFDFANGSHLALIDPRRFGRAGIADDAESFIAAEHLGPDALDRALTLQRFRALLAGRKGTVKTTLMDQALIAGIGNIFSDEIVFRARLHPQTPVARLDPACVGKLYRTMRSALRQAIARGAGDNAFIDRLPKSWFLPHREKGERCPRCGGRVGMLRFPGRSAYFCPRCQKR